MILDLVSCHSLRAPVAIECDCKAINLKMLLNIFLIKSSHTTTFDRTLERLKAFFYVR